MERIKNPDFLKKYLYFHQPGIREGQALFNAAYSVFFNLRDKIYSEVVGTNMDPFYRDGNIERFFDWLEKQ